MYKTDNKNIWRVFREHHYLTKDINKACDIYLIYWGDVLVGMTSVLNIPCGTIKYGVRGHRLVILPDYQGFGFGSKINDFVSKAYFDKGYKYFIRTTHIRLGKHLNDSAEWKSTTSNLKKRKSSGIEDNIKNNQTQIGDERIAYSFEYVGKSYTQKEIQKIVCIGDEEKEVAKDMLNKIIDKDKCPVIISGNAIWSETTIWEDLAKEMGIRTEILFIKRKDKYTMNESKLKSFDAIITSEEEQLKISKRKKEIRKLFSYNYEKDNPKPTLWIINK